MQPSRHTCNSAEELIWKKPLVVVVVISIVKHDKVTFLDILNEVVVDLVPNVALFHNLVALEISESIVIEEVSFFRFPERDIVVALSEFPIEELRVSHRKSVNPHVV